MRFQSRKSILAGLILPCLLLFGCNKAEPANSKSAKRSEPPANPGAAVAATVEVVPQDYSQTVELPGASVRGMESTLVMAKVGGFVKKIGTAENGAEIDIGSVVAKDAVLATLEIPEIAEQLAEAEAVVAAANAEAEQAKALGKEKQAIMDLREEEYENIAGLVARGSIRDNERLEAEFAVKAARAALESNEKAVASAIARANVAKAALDRLKTRVGYARITAPYAGLITKRMVDHGSFVQPATSNSGAMPLFEITRIDKVRIVASVPNTQATAIQVGQPATLAQIGGLPDIEVPGTVARSAMVHDHASRMMRIEVHIDNPVAIAGRELTIQPGMFGTLTVQIKNWDALPTVPKTAVGTDSDGCFVMVVEDLEQKKVRKQPVQVVFDDAVDVGIQSAAQIIGRTVLRDSASELK